MKQDAEFTTCISVESRISVFLEFENSEKLLSHWKW